MKSRVHLPLFSLSDSLPVWFSQMGPQADVVFSTRVRIARNLAHRRFPYNAGRAERREIFEQIASVLEKEKPFGSFTVINCSSLTQTDLELLLEERMISTELVKMEGDRGVAVEEGGGRLIMINEEDHLRLHSLDSGFKADEVWRRLDQLDNQLGGYLPYAYDVRRGFLTSCPSNAGTGLRVSFLLHLPGLVLTKTIDSVLLGASQMGISTRGFFGEHSEIVGNLFQMSNQATLGACEEEFLLHTRKVISEVITHERTAREKVLSDAPLELSDKVFRAWGILLHARMLSMTEFLNLSSALRFGIDSGIFKELTAEQLNRLTLEVMPAHLQIRRNTKLTDEKRHVERAERVREFIGSVVRTKHTGRVRKGSIAGI